MSCHHIAVLPHFFIEVATLFHYLYIGGMKFKYMSLLLFEIVFCFLSTGVNFMKFQYFSRLLGLCNNFGYVVMLSAAHDILAVNGTDQVLRNNLLKVLWPLL